MIPPMATQERERLSPFSVHFHSSRTCLAQSISSQECTSLIGKHCFRSNKMYHSSRVLPNMRETLCPRRPASWATFNASACGVGAVAVILPPPHQLRQPVVRHWHFERERERERKPICEQALLHGVHSVTSLPRASSINDGRQSATRSWRYRRCFPHWCGQEIQFRCVFANARTLGVSDKHALRTESGLTAFPPISLKRWPETPELYPPGCYLAPFRDAGAVIVPRLRR